MYVQEVNRQEIGRESRGKGQSSGNGQSYNLRRSILTVWLAVWAAAPHHDLHVSTSSLLLSIPLTPLHWLLLAAASSSCCSSSHLMGLLLPVLASSSAMPVGLGTVDGVLVLGAGGTVVVLSLVTAAVRRVARRRGGGDGGAERVHQRVGVGLRLPRMRMLEEDAAPYTPNVQGQAHTTSSALSNHACAASCRSLPPSPLTALLTSSA